MSYAVPQELQAEVLDCKVFAYSEEGLSVILFQFGFSKRPPLKSLAEMIKRSIYRDNKYEAPEIALVSSRDRVSLSGTFFWSSHKSDFKGVVIGSRNKAWIVLVRSWAVDTDAPADVSRIIDSVSMSEQFIRVEGHPKRN